MNPRLFDIAKNDEIHYNKTVCKYHGGIWLAAVTGVVFMNVLPPSQLLAAAEQLTLAEKGISAAKVILTGFVVVFAVLLLLILIIKIYSAIVGKAQNVSSKRAEKKVKVKEGELKLSNTPARPLPAASPAPAVEDGISEEVVAVISAAVYTMYGSSGKARIKSIKKSDGKRPAWANAGILENTRPF